MSFEPIDSGSSRAGTSQVIAFKAIAFKEWAAIVLALERGQADVILRRGGIDEDDEAFTPRHREMLLMPTYFHQQGQHLLAEYAPLVDEAFRLEPLSGRLRIKSRATVIEAFPVRDETALERLTGRHLYRPEYAIDRLERRDGKALYAMVVKVDQLREPLELPLRPEYGGCRSWVELQLESGRGSVDG